MKRVIQVTKTGLIIFLMCLIMTSPVLASSEANFHVTPVLPENQAADSKGYFDLTVSPGQKQYLSIVVSNTGKKEIVVDVEAITASTNLNGVVNYTTPGESHHSLPYSLAELVEIEEPVMTIPANSTKTVKALVTMPEDEYEGYLLGAIHIKKQLTDEQLNSGETIINQFSYAVAVKLTEQKTAVENDFTLEGIQAELSNGRASVVNRIVNPEPILVKGMNTTVQIFPQGSSKPIMERTMESTNMAPNSIFPFTLVDDAGYGVRAGSYLSVIDIDYNGQNWHFEEEFVIDAEDAAVINAGAVNLGTAQNAFGLPFWAIVVMALGAILLIVILILLLYLLRKMKREEETR